MNQSMKAVQATQGHYAVMARGEITMSSRDISDLVESRHDDVKRSIERLAERGIIQLPPLADVKNHLNQNVQVYLVGKRDSYIVVAQLSPEFTARLVDRRQDLEAALSPAVPRSFAEALRIAADLEEEKQRLADELTAAAPKIEFVDRYCTASGSMSFRQVAKLLNAREPELRLFLIENDIMYRLGGTLTPMAQHIDAGRFEVKTGTSLTSNHAFSQARFTAKGVKWIGGLWVEHLTKRGLQ